jgi:HPt (histidine-containing phosphotransfer) domain-containing protein
MDDFLIKPFDDRQMAEMLLRWLTPGATAPDADIGDDDAGLASSEPAPTAQDAVIDLAVIDGLRAIARPGRPSPLAVALPSFLQTAPAIVAAIRGHCANGDADALWRAAHALRSSAGALGAKRLSLRCGEIEARARATGIEAARAAIDFLEEDLAAAVERLKTLAEEAHEPA